MDTTAPNEPVHGVRERILAAAKAEFAAHGLQAASVRSIAARAGVTAAMINYYYRSKRALYDIIVEQAQGRLHAYIAAALTTADDHDLPAHLTGAYFDFLSEEGEFQRLLLREILDGSDSLSVFVERHVAPIHAQFEERFGSDEAAFQSAISIFGAVAGYFLYHPVVSQLVGADVLGADHLRRRRQHVVALAALLSRTTPDSPTARRRP